MLRHLLKSKTGEKAGDRLYAAAVAQARKPEFYTDLGAPDRIDARFELYTLHVLLLVLRLRDEGDVGTEPAQVLFDTYVSALDHALRELGVGDISMARKMRNLGEALYGRMTAYEAPLRAGDAETLAEGLSRNLYAADSPPGAVSLARYALAARAALAAQGFDAVMKSPAWPEIAR